MLRSKRALGSRRSRRRGSSPWPRPESPGSGTGGPREHHHLAGSGVGLRARSRSAACRTGTSESRGQGESAARRRRCWKVAAPESRTRRGACAPRIGCRPSCASSSTSPGRSSPGRASPCRPHGFADHRRGGQADRRGDRRAHRDQVAGADRRPHEGRRREVRRHARGGRAPRRGRSSTLEINGHMPRGVLVDSRVAVKQEYYAGVIWDGTRKRPVMIFSDMGGIDIEEVAETASRPRRPRPLLEPAAARRLRGQGGRSPRSASPAAALNRLTPILAAARAAVRRVRHDARGDQPARASSRTASFVAVDAHMDMENEARAAPEGAAEGARRRRRGDAPGARGDAVRARRRGGRRRWTTAAWPAT